LPDVFDRKQKSNTALWQFEMQKARIHKVVKPGSICRTDGYYVSKCIWAGLSKIMVAIFQICAIMTI